MILEGNGISSYEILSVVETESFFERKIGVIWVETWVAKNELLVDAGEDPFGADVGERAIQTIARRPFRAAEWARGEKAGRGYSKRDLKAI